MIQSLAVRLIFSIWEFESKSKYLVATRLSLHIIYTYEPLFTPLSSPTREGTYCLTTRGRSLISHIPVCLEQETWLTGIVSALNILRGMALVHINSKILLGREIFIRVSLYSLSLYVRDLMGPDSLAIIGDSSTLSTAAANCHERACETSFVP
jgi:hypothetical protein